MVLQGAPEVPKWSSRIRQASQMANPRSQKEPAAEGVPLRYLKTENLGIMEIIKSPGGDVDGKEEQHGAGFMHTEIKTIRRS